MSEKYLIASDFDGTIIHWPSGVIDDEDREAIKRFRAAGNIFVVVTGRMYGAAVDVFESSDFHDMDGFLCLSGALAARPDGSVIYEKKINASVLPEMADFFRGTGARYMNIDVGTRSYSFDIGGDLSFGFPMLSHDELSKLDTFTSLNVGYVDDETAHEVCKMLAEKFGSVITPLQNKNAIDMPPAGVNKAVGVKFAGEMFNISDDKIFTVGDGHNDIDMVRAFNGSAMDCGPDELKCAAKRTVHRVHEIIDIIMSKRG